MKRFDGASSKDLVEDGNLCEELSGDFLEASGQLGHIRESDLQVVAQIREHIALHPRNNRLDNYWVLLSVNLVNDLVLSLQVDGGAHENERSIECVFVAALFRQPQVNEAGRNNFVLDALFLALVVDAHVSNDTEAELCNLGEPVLKLLASLIIAYDLVELPDGISAKERFNTGVAKCDVDEGFEKMD